MRIGIDYVLHGFGYPASDTIEIVFWENGVMTDVFDVESDGSGGFVEGFYSFGTLTSPVVLTVIATASPSEGSCSDSVGLRLLPETWPFTDVDGHPFEADIMWLYTSGITKGCASNRFCPDLSVTRGQMAAFLVRALDLLPAASDYFTDDETSIFEGDINSLAASGITKGCTSTTFCPEATITREQMAAFLDRAMNLSPTTNDYFTDDEGSLFEGSINRLAASDITKGCTATTFCRLNVVTRGQMAAFLHRARTM
jgi:S-layer homology domain